MSDDATLTFLLAEEKAYWFKNSSVLGLLPDGGLIREWRNVPKAHREACISALKARRKETNPKVEGIEHTGLYRIVNIDDVLASANSYTIRETLALGMATTIDTALNVSRIGDDTDIPGAGTTWPASPAHPDGTSSIQTPLRKVTLKWVNIDPNALEAIKTARTDVSAATLTVNGETLTGTFYKTKIVTTQDTDGSGIYSETWSLAETAFESVSVVGNRELTANRYIQDVPKNRVATVLNSEITALGATYAAAGLTYTQRISWKGDVADITTEASTNTTATKTNASRKTLSSTTSRTVTKDSATLPDATAAAQGKTYSVVGDITPDGEYDHITETDTAVKQEITLHTATISASKTTTEKVGKNLYNADLADYEPITQTDGHIVSLEKRVNPDGTYDDVVRDEASTSQTATDDIAGTSDRHYDDDTKTIDAVVNTAAAAAEADVDFTTQGTVTDVKNAPNEDGTFRTDVETTVSKKQEEASPYHSAQMSSAKTVTERYGNNLHDADIYDSLVDKTARHIKSLEKRENKDGTFDEVFRDEVSIDQTATAVGPPAKSDQHFDSLEKTEDTVVHTAADAALDDVAYSTAGTLVETENVPNEDGTFRTRAKTTVSKELTLLEDVVVEDKFRQVQADIGNNILAATITSTFPIAKTTGEVQTRTRTANPDGTFQVERKRDIAVQDVTNSEVTDERKAFETFTRAVERNSSVAATPAAQSAGAIVAVTNKVTDYNLTDITLETRTAVSATNGVASEASKTVAADSVETTTGVKNATAEPDLTTLSFTAGQIDVKRKRKNDFALWDVESSTDKRQDLSIPAPASLAEAGNMVHERRSSSLTQVIDGQTDEPDALDTSYGRLSYRKDKYGRYVGERTITTYNDTFTVPGWPGTDDSDAEQNIVDFIQKKNGDWYKRTATMTVTESTHTTMAAAATAAAGGYSYAHFKSGFGALGPRQYWARYVTNPTFAYEAVTELN